MHPASSGEYYQIVSVANATADLLYHSGTLMTTNQKQVYYMADSSLVLVEDVPWLTLSSVVLSGGVAVADCVVADDVAAACVDID